MPTNRRSKLRSGFNLGGEQAEADPLLHDAFLSTGQYQLIASIKDPHCFIVGRTGAGKSASFQRLEQEHADHVIRINPEDLSLPYITDLQAIRFLEGLDVHLDPLWIALWKHVFLVEIIRKRYRVTSPATKTTFFEQIKQLISRDEGKKAALEYLDEFEGKFWCEADERVREITDKFARRVEVEANAAAELPGVGVAGLTTRYAREQSEEQRAELAARFQRIVNETQLARLNMMMRVLDEDILVSQHDHVFVVIDDLDREWVDQRLVHDLIRCLFRTVHDLKRISNLKVLVALRTNILGELEFGRRSGQEEKFRSLMLEIRWTRAELKEMLNERVRAVGPDFGLEVNSISELLPQANRTRGNPLDYIIDRTLLRPRDAIAFVNECLSIGTGKARLSWADIYSAERSYSRNRILALRDEWKATYPGIDRVLEQFRGASARLDRQALDDVLYHIVCLPADREFTGVVWMSELTTGVWGGDNDWAEMYQPVVGLLYGIGFVGCSTATGSQPVFFSDDPGLLDSAEGLDKCEWFYVHRTYQRALDIEQKS